MFTDNDNLRKTAEFDRHKIYWTEIVMKVVAKTVSFVDLMPVTIEWPNLSIQDFDITFTDKDENKDNR